jgi:hypothetical protein
MTTTTTKKKSAENMFDEDVADFFQIEEPPARRNMFEIDVYPQNEDEQFMLDVFHTQSVATAGRSAISQYGTTEIGAMNNHATWVMKEAVEQTNYLESTASVGRFRPHLQNFNNQLLNNTARSILELNTLGVRSMYEDTRRSIYPPTSPPARPKRKGVVRGFKEFLFGEE